MQISCENPQIIVHPNLHELLCKYHHCYFNGYWHYYRNTAKNYYRLDKRPFNSLIAKKLVNKDNYENHFIVDKSTGQNYPVYLCVPCGHCTLCKEKKVQSFVNRIKYESFLYPYKPLFITLTYADKWYPDTHLSLRDLQLFFKRLRINLLRGGFKDRIRYVAVGERGKRTHRGHYHAIIFGLPISNDRDLRRFEDILNKSWSLGFTLSRQVDMSNVHTAYYTCKYLRKSEHEKPSCAVKSFCVSSRRNGGIGSGFFKKQSEQLRKRVVIEPQVLNPWTLKNESLQWSKYALDKIYPSESTYIPLKFRKSVRCFLRNYNYLQETEPDILWLFSETYDKIHRVGLDELFFCPCIHGDFYVNPLAVGDIYEDQKIVESYINNDFSDVHRIAEMRGFLLSNLEIRQCEQCPELAQRVAKIRRNNKRLEALEQL